VLFSELCGSLPKACVRFHPLQKLIPTQARWDSLRDIVSYRDLVISFTKRDFTYDADILRAFAGISGFLETKMQHGRMLYGLPSTDLILALSWVAQGRAIRRHTCTSMDGAGRLSLPSWSWAGWTGRKCWMGPLATRNHSLEPNEHRVNVRDIEIVPFDEGFTGYCLPKDTATACILKFSAVCVPTSQFHIKEHRSQPLSARHLEATNHYDLHIPVHTIGVHTTEGIFGYFSEWVGFTFGVDMEQLQDPGTFLIHLAHWIPLKINHDDFTLFPKPYDNVAARKLHSGDGLYADGVLHEYLVARWINDERTVCERLGFAQVESRPIDYGWIDKGQRIVHLV
jgi:hypothetical protein